MCELQRLAVFLILVSQAFGEVILIDMTHTLDENNVVWPGDPPFTFNILVREQLENFWYEINSYSTGEHQGTHMDAPAHFSRGKWRVHEIPMRNLIGPGVVIDISERAKTDPDTQVEIEDILSFERKYGEIPARAMVLMNSGWGKKWPNKTEVFGTNDPSNSTTFHFPGFSGNATRWLVENRNHINAIGVDTPSLDFGQTQDFVSHVTALGANILGLENVANIDKIPVTGSTVSAIPLKLRDGSGCQIRMFSVLNVISSGGICNSCPWPPVLLSFVLFLISNR